MSRGHVRASPEQVHRPRVDGQREVGRLRQLRRTLHHSLDDPGQQRDQILDPGHPHRIPQPAVGGVVPGRHHPDHRAIAGPTHRSPRHPPQHVLARHPRQRDRVAPHRRPRPHPRRAQMPERRTVISDPMPGHNHLNAGRHPTRRHQQGRGPRQRRIQPQHRQVMRKVHRRHPRRPGLRLTRRQTVHHDPRTDQIPSDMADFDARVDKHMRCRGHHTRRDLETRTDRRTVRSQDPAQEPRYRPVHQHAPSTASRQNPTPRPGCT
jgi:hypothetical protein